MYQYLTTSVPALSMTSSSEHNSEGEAVLAALYSLPATPTRRFAADLSQSFSPLLFGYARILGLDGQPTSLSLGAALLQFASLPFASTDMTQGAQASQPLSRSVAQ